MGELISGKDALIALANGKEVQSRLKPYDTWNSCIKFWTVNEILSYTGAFRIKPRTTTINGIEVPSPQKDIPKKGDDVFTLDFTNNCGGFTSWKCQHSINTFSYEWWRTEDEIKQVVAALRSVFNIKQMESL